MNRKIFLMLGLVLILSVSKSQPCTNNKNNPKYIVAAYYFPQWHVDEKNQRLHGYPWTEWETLKVAKPRFEGHEQPKVPLWGYEDEADPKIMQKKITTARQYCVNTFIFDWYYNNNGPFLQNCLDDGFLKAKNVNEMKFAVMWANHDLGKTKGEVTKETFDKIINICINKYFKNPSYLKIDGCPYFSIYQMNTFISSFGSIENARAELDSFRMKTKAAGFKDLHINAVAFGLKMPDGIKSMGLNEISIALGINSIDTYVWTHHIAMKGFPVTPYDSVANAYFNYAKQLTKELNIPYHPNVTMGWDPSPRSDQNKPFVNTGYPNMPILVGNTVQEFRKGLMLAKNMLDKTNMPQRMVTINSWNEWTEGSYLEPDTIHKMGYLEAIRSVFKSD